MFAFVVAGVAWTEGAALAAGREFVLSAPFLPWLAPALILAGAAVQVVALAFLWGAGRHRDGAVTLRRRLCCGVGALLVVAGAALDRDVTVAVGEALALAGIWFAWGPR